MNSQPLPGFRDFYPADLAFRNHIFAIWRRVATRYGFEEYDGPPLEPLELYTAKSGDEIVGQLYEFVDKGKRAVALRPEMTPSLARMVAARANGLKKPIRWFAIPQLFRYERQQRGRLKEHFQLNCDLIGEPGPQADAEIIALAIDIMRALGLGPTDVRVRISDRELLQRLLQSVGVETTQFGVAYGVIDKIERMPRDVARQALAEGGLGAEVVEGVLRVVALQSLDEAETLLDGARDATASLRTTLDALHSMGLGSFLDLDFRIVRGLAYYTGTVFELFDAKGELRAICGGGRYDKLVGALGGVDLPCVGFGMGDVVLGELLRDRKLAPDAASAIDAFVAGITAEDQPYVLRLAHELREAGVRVEYSLREEALGKQLKLADARQAAFGVVIGPDDRARGEVQLKDLGTKSQTAVALDRVKDELLARLDRSTVDSQRPMANG